MVLFLHCTSEFSDRLPKFCPQGFWTPSGHDNLVIFVEAMAIEKCLKHCLENNSGIISGTQSVLQALCFYTYYRHINININKQKKEYPVRKWKTDLAAKETTNVNATWITMRFLIIWKGMINRKVVQKYSNTCLPPLFPRHTFVHLGVHILLISILLLNASR